MPIDEKINQLYLLIDRSLRRIKAALAADDAQVLAPTAEAAHHTCNA